MTGFDFPVIPRVYKEIQERSLYLYRFEPETHSSKRGVILFFHGGTFKQKPLVTPALFQQQANFFTSLGMTAVCVDYRNGSDVDFTPKKAMKDTADAIRWVRQHADSLQIDPEKLAVCGSSAGGYVTVSSIMFKERFADDRKAEAKAVPNALIVFAAGMDAVDIMQRRYPQYIDSAMSISPIHHIKKCLPPTLWLCGTADQDYEQNKRFTEQMVAAGNSIIFHTYPEMEHGFFKYGRHEDRYFHETNQRIFDFLKEQDLL